MADFSPHDFDQMRSFFNSGATADYGFRKQQLLALKQAVQRNESAIMQALYNDLHKSAEEAYTTEIGFIYAEISHTLKHLQRWMKPQKVGTPLALQPSKSYILKEPLGICLLVAPWNYPFQLLLAPLIGAIAGGNCAVLKPSEIAVHTSQLVVEMIGECFDRKYVAVVEGNGAVVVPKLLQMNRFDHVFFTGSTQAGKSVALLAAEKFTATTLELGGKSPCIVDEDADIEVAAKRITWGKFTNAGQTCVAPDYVLVHEKNKQQLVAEIQKSIAHFYGSDPALSQDYGRIVSDRRLQKLQEYLSQGQVISGGEVKAPERYFAPTLMDNITAGAPVMEEEIFGPILPILSYKTTDAALQQVNLHPNPLALYYFGNDKESERRFTRQVAFGGGCINNTLMHLGNPALPFGGVGSSGIGAYHGRFSFDTYTRQKAILKTSTWFDPAIKYPPYKGKLGLLRWFFK